MTAGYGRGYYGASQLARSAPRRRNWFAVVAVLGVGAAGVWLLWPRKVASEFIPVGKEPAQLPLPPPQLGAIDTTGSALVTGAVGAFLKQLEDEARARGFTSVKDYEDSVIASAKQLQAAGAKVVLAPHLQHLAPQLAPPQLAPPLVP